MAPPRSDTMLARLLHDRNWSCDDFRRVFDTTARTLSRENNDLRVPGPLSDRQAKRWIAGQVATRPYPAACRVLEEMFHVSVEDLLTRNPTRYRETQAVAPPPVLPRPVMVPAQAEPGSGPPREEVSPSRRRDLLGTGILLAASTATTGATSRAAQISRAIAASTPDPLSVAQLHQGIQRLTQIYATTPRGDLLGPVEQAWDDAEARLETRVSGADRRDLELLAGQYAFYRGRLAFDMGDDDGALTFFVLAAQHAQAAGDPLLTGSVAAMRSAVAFFAREFETAADIAAQAQPQAHPYIVPILASAQARAYALTGREDEALTALRTMRDHVWSGSLQPGPSPIDEEAGKAFTAVILGYLGKGDEAEPHARASLAMLSGTGRYVSTAGTHLALARAFIHRTHPDPEQAATAVSAAIVTMGGKEIHPRTVTRAVTIWRRLVANPEWARLEPVRDLGEQVSSERRALPAGPTI
ncbi:hypothetical protein E0F15_22725 [Frankia sp. B2]|uniref:hypothetical protein n=2 Tax=Frankiaceae TaxID=74712 RepID=UPI0003CFE483|nr:MULTISPECIES: hypothetical protein [Frankia]ETA03186.1 hypothetical protein CcI6DRAFT_01341 [Frankia sp. CcI6]OAA18138.1 hypothetical protein AAY23_11453 [Frankia casuarinae]OHV47495.1 hypothetical protein CgIS1_22160 [Frankia sp. CgIS1]TFE23812.1 hypothetical protein E0F15_22725 [Frankia sp. B2]